VITCAQDVTDWVSQKIAVIHPDNAAVMHPLQQPAAATNWPRVARVDCLEGGGRSLLYRRDLVLVSSVTGRQSRP
jgi:hypothetical protein